MSFKRGVHCISVLWSRMPIISTVDSTCVSREGEFLRGAEDRIPYHQTQEASWLLLLICPRLFLWIHDVETETPEEGKPHWYWPRQLKSRSQFLHHKVKNFSNRNCGQIPLSLASPIQDCEGWWSQLLAAQDRESTGFFFFTFYIFPTYAQTCIYLQLF